MFRCEAGSFLYLAMLMDLYSRRIVAWELRDHMKESLVLAALREAIALRNPRAGLIHHSDRGGQYAGKKYRRVLERAEMCQSMSRADSCYDNAFMESCFGTIKTELEMECYENERVARSRNSCVHPLLQHATTSFVLGLPDARRVRDALPQQLTKGTECQKIMKLRETKWETSNGTHSGGAAAASARDL